LVDYPDTVVSTFSVMGCANPHSLPLKPDMCVGYLIPLFSVDVTARQC
jgi:hypothetical protein